MARESRRRRDERRFGRPERLADLVVGSPPDRWHASPAITAAIRAGDRKAEADARGNIEIVRADLASIPIFAIDDVAEFYFEHPRCVWDFVEDIPAVAIPFPAFFAEFRTPASMIVEGGDRISAGYLPDRIGWVFRATDAEAAGYAFAEVVDGEVRPRPMPEARWFVTADYVCSRGGVPTHIGLRRWFPVGADGRVLAHPCSMIAGDYGATGLTPAQAAEAAGLMLVPALLSLAFLNCKNVSVAPVEPDAALNRGRRKAGLRPFLRYHVLDIEPMRRVLRAEGGIEANGLKKALHIVRGHFATYTEERPLFGRLAGTFWVPAHARGSLEAGAVVKDYRVKAPAV